MAQSSDSRRIVLITGCSDGGIGFYLQVICFSFFVRNCHVYATARRMEAMDKLPATNISKMVMDVTDDAAVNAVVAAIIEKEGRIDILVNNAGVNAIGPVTEAPIEKVIKTFDTNTYSILRTSTAVFPHMASRKSGHIVNIGSVVGAIATPWNGIYAASKAAVRSLTDSLDMECRPFNIRVTLVVPGAVRSNIAENDAPTVNALPETSLYHKYRKNIVDRLYLSQGPSGMATDVFAEHTVSQLLRDSPPQYLTAGGLSLQMAILTWLPRTFVLWLLWRMMSKTT
ncbi:oxidoreductase [Fistulina hepatica ATCC 64428]|uniref:Oxidoreductase n=1 Tax=Fistulina hepatica ATCC 64428 TaxID=1128425 RepID=A0A0D7AHI7_9AGAR|nr:oxidoreductase [Fistulina hepatica ATCC 64428]